MDTTDHVLVTGAGGLVGKAVTARLVELGSRVTPTDLDTPANRKLAETLGQPYTWCDLTDPDAVDRLLATTLPTAVVHLAALIPPLCYRQPELARRVNVDATSNLVAAARQQPTPPRFVQASSVAVYGARNPYAHDGLLTSELPMAPTDLYGELKAEVEQIVRDTDLDWTVLRLGGVLTVERMSLDLDVLAFERSLPTDGRIQTVDVRDVAHAFVAAATADSDVVRDQIFLIGGDDATHRLHQRDISAGMSSAMGLTNVLPTGEPGDPADDTTWFATDWMDTAPAQAVLAFQHHTWPGLQAEVRDRTGLLRYLLMILAPLIRFVLARKVEDDPPKLYRGEA